MSKGRSTLGFRVPILPHHATRRFSMRAREGAAFRRASGGGLWGILEAGASSLICCLLRGTRGSEPCVLSMFSPMLMRVASLRIKTAWRGGVGRATCLIVGSLSSCLCKLVPSREFRIASLVYASARGLEGKSLGRQPRKQQMPLHLPASHRSLFRP